MNNALLSSKKMNWITPQDFYQELDSKFHFVVDLAASKENAKCEKFFTEQDDSLSQSWKFDGFAFCNPPYGRQVGKWVKKAYEEHKFGAKIVLLIPARTDTSYFHDYIYGKAEIYFIRGRLKFIGDDGKPSDPAPFPSMVVVYR